MSRIELDGRSTPASSSANLHNPQPIDTLPAPMPKSPANQPVRTPAAGRPIRLALLCILATLPATRCGTGPDPRSSGSGGAAPNDAGVLASAINVTPFEVTVVLSGVLDDAVDTVERTIASRDSTDVDFVCVDELAVGDPLEPEAPGVVIAADDEAQEVEAFSVFLDEAFFCGDVVEIIISGNDAETFAVDVFAFTPP